MHMAASVKETRDVCKSIHSTTDWKLDELPSYLPESDIYKHSTFLRHKVIHALPNTTVLL